VVALGTQGFAELASAPAAVAVKLPDDVAFDTAASMPLNYLTAHHGLHDRARLAAKETVVVIGAAGGVGSAAIQVARAHGARVVAAASTEEKRAFAMQCGADATIDTNPDGWRDRLKPLCGGKGPDVVFDPVCGALFEPAFRSLVWGGRHLVVGFVGGIPALPANLPLLKGAALVGVDVRQFMLLENAKARVALNTLVAQVGAGALAPPVGRLIPFEKFAEALRLAGSGTSTGKVVLAVAG
jgi:NADPH2:quinone reductase